MNKFDYNSAFERRREREAKARKHKEHIRKQKEEAEYNNQVKGHHTNQGKNITKKLINSGVDFRGRFPIGLKFSERDFSALKKMCKE
jgi:hypothetical protein